MKRKPFKDRHKSVFLIRNWRHRDRLEGTLHRHKRRLFILNGCEGPDSHLQLLEKLVPNDPSIPLGERWEVRMRVAAMIDNFLMADS